MSHDNTNHISPYTLIAGVLVTLLAFTFITVYISHFHFGALSIAVALGIACIKAGLVLAFFMHLKFDHPLFKIMVVAVILLFATFIILTMVDYLFR
jgi:cytochrome c oxidase subunit 4